MGDVQDTPKARLHHVCLDQMDLMLMWVAVDGPTLDCTTKNDTRKTEDIANELRITMAYNRQSIE